MGGSSTRGFFAPTGRQHDERYRQHTQRPRQSPGEAHGAQYSTGCRNAGAGEPPLAPSPAGQSVYRFGRGLRGDHSTGSREPGRAAQDGAGQGGVQQLRADQVGADQVGIGTPRKAIGRGGGAHAARIAVAVTEKDRQAIETCSGASSPARRWHPRPRTVG